MKDNIINAVGDKLDNLNIYIYDVEYGIVDGENTLTIIVDSNDNRLLSINEVVMATRIINPILDKLDPVKNSYTLDVYAKEKEI